MATSYYFQTQKSFSSVLLSISLTFLLLPLNNKVVNSLESVTFSFPKFSQGQQNLILQGDANITSTGKLQLTQVGQNGIPLGWSLGRALYSAPIHMWDSTTGNVASFVTTFSFLINNIPGKASMADGLAFFISTVDTEPQTNGGFLGVFNQGNYSKTSQTVAVEFDTLFNRDWDPTGHHHIGIDVGSIKSKSAVLWNYLNDTVADVVISYRAPTNVLTVTMVYPSVATSYVLSDVVILKEVLPEWVRIGFSATTGLSRDNVETNDILSWTFHSELRHSNDAHPSSSILHEPI